VKAPITKILMHKRIATNQKKMYNTKKTKSITMSNQEKKKEVPLSVKYKIIKKLKNKIERIDSKNKDDDALNEIEDQLNNI